MDEYASDREIALESLRVLQGIDERLKQGEKAKRTAEITLEPALCRWDTAPEVYGSTSWNLQTLDHALVSFTLFARNLNSNNEVILRMDGDYATEVNAKFASPYPKPETEGIDYIFREPVIELKWLPVFHYYEQCVLINSPILGSTLRVLYLRNTITIKYYIEASLIGTIGIKGAS